MPTLPNMGLITPTLGGDTGTWGAKINTLEALVDSHDHSSGKGVQITPSGININADLAFAGNAATGLGKVAFTAVAALAAGAVTLFVNTADNELYWRTAGGTNVKLTAGTSINTSLVGGIVGDYTAVSAQVAYDAANTRYTFKQASPGLGWAVMASGEVRIYETGTTETVYVGQKAPAALAASYAVTWPLALPASTMPLTSTTGGVLDFGASFAMQNNANITLSGTGSIKHGSKRLNRPIKSAECSVTVGSLTNAPPGGVLGATSTVYAPLPDVPPGARILNVYLYYGSAADAAACTAILATTSDAVPCVGGFTDLGADVLTPGGTSIANYSGINYQPTNAGSLWVKVGNTTGGERISATGVDYDIP